MEDWDLKHSVALPLGTVRLMETFGIEGAVSEKVVASLRRRILALLMSKCPRLNESSSSPAVACGGNAEALAQIAPGPRVRGVPTISLPFLQERMGQILRLDVPARMKAFGVRRDRAEVMGLAALVLTTLGNYLGLRELLVPGVGVREGVLLDLVAAKFARAYPSRPETTLARTLLNGARWFARRLDYDARHAEQVRRLALALFDQLRPIHLLGSSERLLLELAAILHDIGHCVQRRGHHRHGEYLVRQGEIPGLRGWRREMVANLVRYHNSKSEPRRNHKSYAALTGARRRVVRQLSAILRIAERLEKDHRRAVAGLEVEVRNRTALFHLQLENDARLDAAGILRKAALFEREFGLKVALKRAPLSQQVA